MCERKKLVANGERRETTIRESVESCPTCGTECYATVTSYMEGRLDDGPDTPVAGGMTATYEPIANPK